MKHLLVIGASGVLGNSAARYFLEKGYKVTAFVRDLKKVTELAALGAIVKEGDITQPSTYGNILSDVDVILTAVHSLMGKGNNNSENVDLLGHKQLIDAALKAGVPHFIYTSATLAGPDNTLDFSRYKYDVEQYLSKSGLSYTILRPAAFMEWHAFRLLGKNIIEKGKTTILGKGDTPMNFIAVKDVVTAIDHIISGSDYRNTIINLAGPGNYSRNEVADLFGKATGKTYKTGHMPIGMVNLLGALMKPFHPGLARVMRFTALSEGKDASMDAKDTIQQFGLRPTTLVEYINETLNK
jgi:uncharacterized protein YbjT (DUF2867 family)